MKVYGFLFLFCIALPNAKAEEPVSQHDLMGGWKQISAEAKLYFYTKHVDGIWWLINPAGNAFLSKGVNHISYTGDQSPALARSPYWFFTMKEYQQSNVWADVVIKNLKQWNFNTIGAHSTPSLFVKEMPYTIMLDICFNTGGDKRNGFLPDVFDEDFKRKVLYTIKTKCEEYKNDIYLLGYFSDYELHWGEDEKSHTSLLINYLFLPANSAGGKYANSFLQEQYTDIASFNEAWGLNLGALEDITTVKEFPASQKRKEDEAEFLKRVAAQYFKTCSEALKEVDPNHLYLGCRFRGKVKEPVLNALTEYVDVVCYNNYDAEPPRIELLRIFDITKKPVLLSEFSFKSADSNLPNSVGAGTAVDTQADRAELFESYVTNMMELPFMVGYHWYQYTDQPAEGTAEGENNNYGLVNLKDEAWKELTDTITKTNEKIERIHARLR
jgi:agarase